MMKDFKKKRKYNSPDSSFLKNHNVSKKHKADTLACENQLPTNWHEVKIILDATVVEKYLKNQHFGSKISPQRRKKIVVQKIPRINQHVFSENNNVMVKLEMPEDIQVGDNLLPEDRLIFDDESVKQEECISVINSSDNDSFNYSEFVEPLHQDFQCQESDNLIIEAALKIEVVGSGSCCEEIIIGPVKDALKNEELFVGQEFKHEETIPSYENVELIDQENIEEIINKSTRSIRKRKKCLDCDDCNHGSIKKSRSYSLNKIVSTEQPVKEPKICSNKSKTLPTSSHRAKEQKSKKDLSNKSASITAIPRSQKPPKSGYQCDHCGYRGERRNLIRHFRIKHSYLFPNDPVRCDNCDLKFNSLYEMQKHRSSVCLLFLICKFCQVNVPSKVAMVRHMKKVHPEKIMTTKGAKIVDKVCRNSMKGDMKTLGQTPCGQKYLEIRKHYLDMVYELIKLYCTTCNVTEDKVRGADKRHCDSCKSRLLYQCQKCKETRALYRNIWTHVVSKNNDCSISANFNLTRDEEATQASETSSNEPKSHDCEICDFKGTSGMQLYEHVCNDHSDSGIIKNVFYACPTCGMSFRLGNVRLKRHKELCGIADHYPCRFCPTTRVDVKRLGDHIALLHFEELDGRDVREFTNEAQDFRRMVKEVNIARFSDKLRHLEAEYEGDYYHHGIESMLKPVCLECKIDGLPQSDYCSKCQERLSFVCLKCDELFSKYSAAWVHATRMCENRCFTLTGGGSRRNYKKVDSSETSKDLLYCAHCSFKNTNRLVLVRHIKHLHSQSRGFLGRFTCTKCYNNFENPGYLFLHRQRCRIRFRYTCHFCHRSSPKFHVIENHITRKHVEQVSGKDTLDEVLQQVIKNKRTHTIRARNAFDENGRMVRRKFSDNEKLAEFYCPHCSGTVDKNLRLNSHTKICPNCNGELRIRCKVCGKSYSKWGSIANHFQQTDCGGTKMNTQPWMQTNELDHSYSRRQPPPAAIEIDG